MRARVSFIEAEDMGNHKRFLVSERRRVHPNPATAVGRIERFNMSVDTHRKRNRHG